MILIVGTTTGFVLTLPAAIFVKLNPKYEFFSLSVVLLLCWYSINIVAICLFCIVPRIRSYLVKRFLGRQSRQRARQIFHDGFATAAPITLNSAFFVVMS